MDIFTEVLYGKETNFIPKEYDWFSKLIGDWEFDYYDGYNGEKKYSRHIKGEWIFRRILNGAGIEDLFICPSRETRHVNPQVDGEYGLAVRMFNPKEKCYDMFYTCERKMCRLKFVLEGEKLVGTVLNEPNKKWVFSEISDNSFRWQNVTVTENNEWRVNSNIYAKRKRG